MTLHGGSLVAVCLGVTQLPAGSLISLLVVVVKCRYMSSCAVGRAVHVISACSKASQQQQLGGPYLVSSSAAGEVAFLVAAGIKGKARTVDKFFEEFFLRGFWR